MSDKIIEPETLKRLQKKSLEMLLVFKDFCDKNGLLFYFCGGCCIGALRNGGFIPWDDDIDIFMPRGDYDRLWKLWNEQYKGDDYSLLRSDKEHYYGQIFTTFVDNNTTCIKPQLKHLDIPQGVAMDIFPLDGCPSGFARKMQKFWALIYSLYLAQVVPVNHGKAVAVLGKIALGIIPSKGLRYRIWRFAERHMSKYPIAECDKITELCAGPHYMQNEYPKSAFESAVYHEFEGYQMPLPVGYDDYLRIAFGDYMTPPPKEKQVAHHDVEFLDLDNSYRMYRGIKYLNDKQ